MNFTYSDIDLASNPIHRLRLVVGDTDGRLGKGVKPNGENFSNEELQAYLDEAGSWPAAAPAIFDTLHALYARYATIEKDGERSHDLKSIAGEYAKAADRWRRSTSVDLSGLVACRESDDNGNDIAFPFGSKQYGWTVTDASN